MSRLAIVMLVFGLAGVVGAADKDDPTGSWQWERKSDTWISKAMLKLELKDGKLTGMLTLDYKSLDPNTTIKNLGPEKVENGKFANGELSFTTSNTVGTKSFTRRFSGKIDGNTIKGSITSDSGKQIDWEAKRVVEK